VSLEDGILAVTPSALENGPSMLADKYELLKNEAKWQQRWEQQRTHAWDCRETRERFCRPVSMRGAF
jgi:hypothetical protein